MKAIADAVEEGMEKKGIRPWHCEAGSSNWVLLDFVDVVLHVFHKNLRQFYNLEKLWGDAKMHRIGDDTAPGRTLRPARRPRTTVHRKKKGS